MVSNIGAAASVGASKAAGTTRGTHVVKAGDTVSSIARSFGMTAKEFKAWVGLKSDNLSVGQQIKIPTDVVPAGKGLTALARKYNMSLADFCKLNGITKNYQPKKGERFYVKQGGLSGTSGSGGTSSASSAAPTRASGSKTVTAYDGKKYPVLEIPSCGYIKGNSKNPGVSGSSAAVPPVPMSGGNVVAEVRMFEPQKKGDLSGKTIMINAGHGWGANGGTPKFKPGTEHKDANGKLLQEWYKNRNLADDVIRNLTARGAKVIYTTGDAKQVCDAKKKFKANLMISLHCDASDSRSANGLKMIYHRGYKNGARFAAKVDEQLSKQYNSKCITVDDASSQHGSLGILSTQSGVPSVLCEMGFMSNSTDIKNIDSRAQREKAAEALGDACVAYFK